MDITNAVDLGAIDIVLESSVPAELSHEDVSRQAALYRSLEDVVLARPRSVDDEAELVSSQLLALSRGCESGKVALSPRIGDYVPLVNSEQTQSSPLPVPVHGDDVFSGDVFVMLSNKPVRIRRACTNSEQVEIQKLGLRRHERGDPVFRNVRDMSGIVSKDKLEELVLHRAPVDRVEALVQKSLGAMFADLTEPIQKWLIGRARTLEADPLLMRDSTSVLDKPANLRPPALLSDIEGRTAGLRLAQERLGALLIKNTDAYHTEENHKQGDLLKQIRSAGITAVQSAVQRAQNWASMPDRHIRGRIPAGEIQMTTPLDIADAADADLKVGGEELPYDMVEIESEEIPKEGKGGRLTPSEAFAFSATAELVGRMGFTLDVDELTRISASASLQVVQEFPQFNEMLSRLKAEWKSRGRSDSHADIIARERVTMDVLRARCERLVVATAYLIAVAFLQVSSSFGRLAITRLNKQSRHLFAAKSGLAATPPSLFAYVSEVAHTVSAVADVQFKWVRSVQSVAEQYADTAKRSHLSKTIDLQAITAMNMTDVDPSLLASERSWRILPDAMASVGSSDDIGDPLYPTNSSTEPLQGANAACAHIVPVEPMSKPVPESPSEALQIETPGALAGVADKPWFGKWVADTVAPILNAILAVPVMPKWAADIVGRVPGLAAAVDRMRGEISQAPPALPTTTQPFALEHQRAVAYINKAAASSPHAL